VVTSVVVFWPTQTAGNILLVLAVIPAVASVVVFWPVVSWRSEWGSHLMSYMIALAVPLVLGTIRLVFGDSPGFQRLRTAAFGALVLALWWRLWLLVRARWEGRPKDPTTEITPPKESA
jgi:hypothetical protein